MCLQVSDRELALAKALLGQFVLAQAKDRAKHLGFGWRSTDRQPVVFEHLQHAYQVSRQTRTPLPVGHFPSHRSVYSSQLVDAAYRFWHDTNHVELGEGFDLSGELEVGVTQMSEADFRPSSLEFGLFKSECLGVVYCLNTARRMPRDSTQFALNCIEHGIPGAVELELVS